MKEHEGAIESASHCLPTAVASRLQLSIWSTSASKNSLTMEMHHCIRLTATTDQLQVLGLQVLVYTGPPVSWDMRLEDFGPPETQRHKVVIPSRKVPAPSLTCWPLHAVRVHLDREDQQEGAGVHGAALVRPQDHFRVLKVRGAQHLNISPLPCYCILGSEVESCCSSCSSLLRSDVRPARQRETGAPTRRRAVAQSCD
ncbi:unnamed protein product [Merluccius merluccius]